MIAQELALLLPTAISSLSLICTAAAVENTTTFAEHMAQRLSLLLPKSVDRSVSDTARQIFSHAWLAQPDDVHLPDPATTPGCHPPTSTPSTDGTEGQAQAQGGYRKFDTNAQRFVAQEMHKRLDPSGRFTAKGFMLQLVAAGWHHKSAAQLAQMADAVGRERILVMHGTEDGMISPPHGSKLIEYVRPAKGLVVEGMGHAPLVERWEWFNGVVEEQCRVGEGLDGRG
jgi:pimeloyl-ACP methyl ester carboxylesterase